jgi:hypothetical protein
MGTIKATKNVILVSLPKITLLLWHRASLSPMKLR